MSSPYGSATGAALDVIIVVPSPCSVHLSQHKVTSSKGDCNGVIASSDFYVTFPSSVQTNGSIGLTSSSAGSRLQRWTSAFLFNTTSSSRHLDDSPTDSGEHVRAESTGPSDRQLPPQIECPQKGNITIQINGRNIPELEMNFRTFKNGESISESQAKFVQGNGYRPPTQALEMLVDTAILNYGRNLIRYILFNDQCERIGAAEAFLYLWSSRDSVIVCDIDGTITKSDVRGVLDTVVQDNFKHIHKGVCKFLNELVTSFELDRAKRDGEPTAQVRLFYLSSRPISYISQTRKLLVGLSQEQEDVKLGLPPGPIMCHRGSLSTVLHSELVAKNVYEFKGDVLARQIVLPFVAAIGNSCKHKLGSESIDNESIWRSESDLSQLSFNATDDRLFLAGFGNKTTDAKAYELAGIDRRDIYIINKDSRIQCLDYDGTQSRRSTDFSPNENASSSTTSLPEFCCGESARRNSNASYVNDPPKELSDQAGLFSTLSEQQPVKSSRPMRKIKSSQQTIRAFSLKKSFASFRSNDSSEESFYGYDDPNLFAAVRERMRS